MKSLIGGKNMGLNDKRKVAEEFVKNKETLSAYLAKTTWDSVCECFNYPDICKDYFIDEDTVERKVEFEFTYKKEIDGNEIELSCYDLLEEARKLYPSDYEYLKPALTGGVETRVTQMVPKTLFKDGFATWEVKKCKLLEDIEKVLEEIAKEEGATIQIRFFETGFLSDIRDSHEFGERINEPLISRGEQPSYKFAATVRVKRL